jgi:hypothetical protein
MTPHLETAKLEGVGCGGNMANIHGEQKPDSNGPDAVDRNVHPSHAGGRFFEIRVKGHLSDTWSDWLEGLEMKLCDNGEMILAGNIVDQAALLGVLNKLNRLNLTLLSVTQVDQSDRP